MKRRDGPSTIRTMGNGIRQGSRGRRAARALAVLAVAGAVMLGGVKVTGVWEGAPFPVADPAATAEHLNSQTLAVYDSLDVPNGLVLNLSNSLGIKADIYDCHGRGLSHFLDNLEDTAPYEPRTAAISAGLTVTGLKHPQAAEALERARGALTAQGWTVESQAAPDHIQLKLKPPSTGPNGVSDTVFVDFYDPSGFFTIEAHAECARYLEGTLVDFEGKPEHLPFLSVPDRVRRE
ncbi:hypothetical protein [Kitasatospora cathayae]|uniref:Tat pathway signal sequence domain protein n=1 Tax=Kitasatospora cathayae TaxID=3004092 RepID=A0ABY7QJS5_9ACTN|nr:hypothetical protein [Kitasatospora sp. HUAS 3-15]WBP92121.1 hypothetical protein O1G21_40595 [Kitasatospora sp. HUAS 3-15]